MKERGKLSGEEKTFTSLTGPSARITRHILDPILMDKPQTAIRFRFENYDGVKEVVIEGEKRGQTPPVAP